MDKVKKAKFHFDALYEDILLKVGPYKLFQTGDLNCTSGYIVEPHTQIVHEISYIVSGKGSYFIDEKEYKMEKGMIFLDTIDEIHAIKSSHEDPLRFFYLGFVFNEDYLHIPKYIELKTFFDTLPQRVMSVVNTDICIQDIFVKIFNELIVKDFLSEGMLESYLTQLISITYRIFNKEQCGKTYLISNNQESKEKFVYDIVNYIDSHIESITNLTDLSYRFGYSYSYITKIFSSIMGEPLKQYYHRKKFEKSAQMLKNGMSVTQISDTLGYNSVHSFSRAFSNYFGVPPSKYNEE